MSKQVQRHQRQPLQPNVSEVGNLTDLRLQCSSSVRHDERGAAVWNWDVATGVLASATIRDLLQKLDHPELEIAGDVGGDVSWNGDPYNRR